MLEVRLDACPLLPNEIHVGAMAATTHRHASVSVSRLPRTSVDGGPRSPLLP